MKNNYPNKGYQNLNLQEMEKETNRLTDEKIKELMNEHKILEAQELYYKKLNKFREGVIRL